MKITTVTATVDAVQHSDFACAKQPTREFACRRDAVTPRLSWSRDVDGVSIDELRDCADYSTACSVTF